MVKLGGVPRKSVKHGLGYLCFFQVREFYQCVFLQWGGVRCIIMDAFELGREFPEVEIDPRLVFDNPTIESLSQAIVDLPKTQRTKSVESASTAQPGRNPKNGLPKIIS